MGPSVTTYGTLNPGFRFYTVDGFYSNSTFVSMMLTKSLFIILSLNLILIQSVTHLSHPYYGFHYTWKDYLYI